MIQLIERVNEIFRDLGECCGVEYPGTAMADFKDAEQCHNDAVVALIGGGRIIESRTGSFESYDEYRGLVLCGKCYAKLQRVTD